MHEGQLLGNAAWPNPMWCFLRGQQHISRAQQQGSRAVQVHTNLLATGITASSSDSTQPEAWMMGTERTLQATWQPATQQGRSTVKGASLADRHLLKGQPPQGPAAGDTAQRACSPLAGGGESSACSTSQHHAREHSCYMPLPREHQSTKEARASDGGRRVQLGEACRQNACSTLAPTCNDLFDAYSCRMARGVFLEVAGLAWKPASICLVRGRLLSMNLSESTTCRAGRADLRAFPSLQGGTVSNGHLQRTVSPCNSKHCSWTAPAVREAGSCRRNAEHLQVESSCWAS